MNEGGKNLKRKFLIFISIFVSLCVAAAVFYVVSPNRTIEVVQDITEVFVPDSEQKVEVISKEAVIYMEYLDELYPMGSLLENELIHIIRQVEDLYEIEWGNGTGFIPMNDVKVVTEGKIRKPTSDKASDTVIYTVETTPIYSNESKELEVIGHLNVGFRYPIIREYGENWWEINVGNRKAFIAKKSTEVDQGVPVLMYHHILTPEEKADSPFAEASTTMTTLEFEEQMQYLSEEGYTTIKTEDLEAYLDRNQNLPAKAILLTMDDGNISSRIYGYPILQKYRLHIDQFIITDRTPEEPQPFDHQKLFFLSQQEMDEMTDHYSYHGHTHTLHRLTEENVGHLLDKSDEEVLEDLRINRERLNGTRFLAYPFGQFNDHVIKLVKQSGFDLAFTTKGGYTTLDVDRMEVPRLGIEPNVTLPEYIDKVKLPRPLKEKAIVIPSVKE